MPDTEETNNYNKHIKVTNEVIEGKETGNFTVYDSKNNQGIFVKTDGSIKTYQLQDTANRMSMVDLPSGTKISPRLLMKTGIEMEKRGITTEYLDSHESEKAPDEKAIFLG